MDNQIIFVIFNNQIHYSQDPNIDYRQLYLSVGGDDNTYDAAIKGIIVKDKIIFFKGNFTYDKDVIDMACKCAPLIKEQVNNPYLKVYCGINRQDEGTAWEPIMEIKDEELTGFVTEKTINEEELKQKELEKQERINRKTEDIVEFKNNYEDPKFINFARLFTLVILGLTILSKFILITTKKIDLSSAWIMILIIAQIALLVVTLLGYLGKKPSAKYTGIAASLALVFMFSFFDVILGVVNLLFTIDQGYILSAITAGKKGISKLKKK